MLRSTKGLVGFTISATDGDIGRVDALYFDDRHWTARYFVVDTSRRLTGRRVLVSPICVRRPDWDRRRLPIALTRAQVEASPDAETRQPLSRQFETAFCHYYGIPSYWQPGEDRHLRSTADVRGRDVHALDGRLGRVDDFLVEDLTWRVRYLEIDTRARWPGQHVLVAPEWIDSLSAKDAAVVVSLPSDTIRSAPPYDRSRPMTRAYEQSLYAHHGHSGYWEDREAA